MTTTVMTKKSFTIREWKREDFSAIQNVLWETWIATYSPFIPPQDLKTYFDQRYCEDEIVKSIEDTTNNGFVAECEGNVVGYLRGQYRKDENRYYVVSVYVLPTSQGLGIGRELLKLAESHARAVHLNQIWLGVMTQNTVSVEWYKKIGFTFVEEQPFQMGETTVAHLIGYKEF